MVEQAGPRSSHIGRYFLCALASLLVAACNQDGSSGAQARTALGRPDIAGHPAVQASVGRLYSFTPVVDGGRPTTAIGFSITNKPAWANFSVSTGQLKGTPASPDVGTYSDITITASNGAAKASLPPFTITVGQGGTVSLNWQAPVTNTDGTPITDLAGYTIAYGTQASSLDRSVIVDNPATTAYTVQNLAVGKWYFAVAAYTSEGSKSALTPVVSTMVQ